LKKVLYLPKEASMKLLISFCLLLPYLAKSQQLSYEDSLNNFIKKYVEDHEIVTGNDKKLLAFYPVSKAYCVTASFVKSEKSKWFLMDASGDIKQQYGIFGILHFTINNTALQLTVYQSKSLLTSEKYKEHLFIPFTDKTSGIETYGGGRYIDLSIPEITNNSYTIDFNKAYNPYCAYAAGYSCPIPPKENDLQVSVYAGEKNLKKH
jgi:uncharacterized protein